MNLNDYQKAAMETAIYKHKFLYPVLEIVSEAGEIAGKFAKILRDKDGKFDDTDVLSIKKEIGDVMWGLAALSNDLDTTLEDVATMNIQKLSARKDAGTIKGSGDDR